MKKSVVYCSAAFFAMSFAAASAFAQPTIGAITNAATFTPPGLPNAPIPQGGFFALFGTNMGPTTPVLNSGAFQTTLGGVSISVVSNGTTVQPLLYFVLAGQINGVLPSNTPVSSTATITVTYNGATSAAFTFPVVSSNFGFFTRNSGGTGPATVQNFTESYSLNSLTATAKPGDVLLLYGTGLGPAVNNQDETSSGTAGGYGTDLRSVDNLDFHLYLGGTEFTSNVSYAGRSENVALDQINFTIPSNAPTGCFVPLIIRIGSVVSNSASISVGASNTTCSDPYGLTSAQITQAATGTLHVGSVLLTRLALTGILPGIAITEDDADVHFYNFTGGDILTNSDVLALSSYGSCQVTNCSNTYTCVPSQGGLGVPGLDGGSALSVSGNGAPTTSVPSVATGSYAVKLGSSPLQLNTAYPLVNFLQPGTFTVTGTGGADVQGFSASVTVPGIPNVTSGAFTWTSPVLANDNINVSRSDDLVLNWQNAGSGDVLISVGSATNVGTTAAPVYNSSTITCLQPASAGTYTIPSWLLEALPASSSILLSGLTPPGAAILMGSYNPVGTFTAPGLDVGFANSLVTSGQNVNLQ